MENLGTAMTEIWAQLGQVLTLVTGSALLLLPFGFKVARKAIAGIKSLMQTGGGRGGR